MNDIQWYIRMMDLTQDTDDRMELLMLAYNEWVADWTKKAGERIFRSLEK